MLYDACASCNCGQWKSSKFLQPIRERHTSRTRGTRKWLTRAEVISRFGEELATQIINRKLFDEELKSRETRPHPDLPENEDLFLYLHIPMYD